MGSQLSQQQIQKKYGKDGINYVASKYNQRKKFQIYKVQIQKLRQQLQKQRQIDIDFLKQQTKRLQNGLKEAREEAEIRNKDCIEEAESRSRQKVEQFSGFNHQKSELQKIERQYLVKFHNLKQKMKQQLKQKIQNFEIDSKKRTKVKEYKKSKNFYKQKIQSQCIQKYSELVDNLGAQQLQNTLKWENYRYIFQSLLNRQQIKKQAQNAVKIIRRSILPWNTDMICC